jgi:hypothetical protein
MMIFVILSGLITFANFAFTAPVSPLSNMDLSSPPFPSCPFSSGGQYVAYPGVTFGIECGIDRSGIDFLDGPLFKDSFAECIESCARIKHCVGVSYAPTPSACYMKATWGPPTPNGPARVWGATVLSHEDSAHPPIDDTFTLEKRGENGTTYRIANTKAIEEAYTCVKSPKKTGIATIPPKSHILYDGTRTFSLRDVMNYVAEKAAKDDLKHTYNKLWEEFVTEENRRKNLAKRRGEEYDIDSAMDDFAEKLSFHQLEAEKLYEKDNKEQGVREGEKRPDREWFLNIDNEDGSLEWVRKKDLKDTMEEKSGGSPSMLDAMSVFEEPLGVAVDYEGVKGKKQETKSALFSPEAASEKPIDDAEFDMPAMIEIPVRNSSSFVSRSQRRLQKLHVSLEAVTQC